ncbi:MAG: hypothetical protein AseanaTS_24390 [Candidatus Pelagadaptatus aseana]|uniref:DUF5610 domain-containing protein n=1 Tax=Candidatus Pelagadaptatus aseana TaxID=3120508 RepID=UPI0039B2E594
MSTVVGAAAPSQNPIIDLAPQSRQTKDLQDSEVSSHARSVDRASDKAATAAAEVPVLDRREQKPPSTVYVSAYESRETFYTYSANGLAPVAQSSGADVAAGNILDFIGNQLARDVADGASEEALESRIEAGLSGFLKGFEQARDEIEGAGLLSQSVESDIQETYEKVLAGVEDLKAQYLGGEAAIPASKSSSGLQDNSQVSRPLGEAPRSIAESYYAQQSVAQSNSLEFTVTTLDGDKVTITTSGLQAMLQEGFKYSGAQGQGAFYGASQYQEYNFSFEIDGNLDKGEMAALTDLLSQVNDLADTFFTGDLEDAFNQALSLGYDSSEISGFALNLSQTTVQRSAVAYQNVADSRGGLSERLAPLGGMVRGLLEATETARAFQYPQQLITSIAEQIDSAKAQQGRFPDFLQQLMETLPGINEAR